MTPRLPFNNQEHPGKQRLQRWLQERQIDLRLRQCKHDATPTPPRVNPLPCPVLYGVEDNWGPGDIRLLHPASPRSLPNHPLYVLILKRMTNGASLICPFSRFAEPATPGEWITGSQSIPLRVLCLWNSRVAPSTLLRQSWGSGKLSQSQLMCALELHEHLASGSPLTRVTSDSVGPPLGHPADPRWLYEEEESRFLDETIKALSPTRAVMLVNETGASPGSLWSLAAEVPPTYTTRRKRPIPSEPS